MGIHDFGTTFKAYRREVIHNIPLYGEMHRFIPALASWYGASICEVPISNPRRQHGQSHYGLSRTVRVCFDLLTIRFLLRYMTRPLHFFGSIGALAMMAGGGLAAWLLALKMLTGHSVMMAHGPIFVIAGVLILAGIQMLGIGLLGELAGAALPHAEPPRSVRRGPDSAAELERRETDAVGGRLGLE